MFINCTRLTWFFERAVRDLFHCLLGCPLAVFTGCGGSATGSSVSRSLDELSSLPVSVERLLFVNTRCLICLMTAVALYACCTAQRERD